MSKKLLIEEKTKEILKFLKISKKPNCVSEELDIAIRLYKYVFQNINLDLSYKVPKADSKSEFYANALYQALESNPGLPDTNAVEFKHLLDMAKFENYLVALKVNNTGNQKIANLVKIGTEFHYFDISLEYELHQSCKAKDDMLYYAGLGREEYERAFTPVAVLKDFSNPENNKLPSNIAEESFGIPIIYDISRRYPNLRMKSNATKKGKKQEQNEPEL